MSASECVTPGENARWVIEIEEGERQSAERQWARRTWRAAMLAPSLEICEALLSDRVPLDRLDPEWVARFGVRDQ